MSLAGEGYRYIVHYLYSPLTALLPLLTLLYEYNQYRNKMTEAELDNFPSLFSLDGKVAVVTGGSRGLGLHAASG